MRHFVLCHPSTIVRSFKHLFGGGEVEGLGAFGNARAASLEAVCDITTTFDARRFGLSVRLLTNAAARGKCYDHHQTCRHNDCACRNRCHCKYSRPVGAEGHPLGHGPGRLRRSQGPGRPGRSLEQRDAGLPHHSSADAGRRDDREGLRHQPNRRLLRLRRRATRVRSRQRPLQGLQGDDEAPAGAVDVDVHDSTAASPSRPATPTRSRNGPI